MPTPATIPPSLSPTCSSSYSSTDDIPLYDFRHHHEHEHEVVNIENIECIDDRGDVNVLDDADNYFDIEIYDSENIINYAEVDVGEIDTTDYNEGSTDAINTLEGNLEVFEFDFRVEDNEDYQNVTIDVTDLVDTFDEFEGINVSQIDDDNALRNSNDHNNGDEIYISQVNDYDYSEINVIANNNNYEVVDGIHRIDEIDFSEDIIDHDNNNFNIIEDLDDDSRYSSRPIQSKPQPDIIIIDDDDNVNTLFDNTNARISTSYYPPLSSSPSPVNAGASASDAESLEIKCTICLDYPKDVSATICGHIFCYQCINTAVRTQRMCSICQHFKTCELIKSEASQLRKITDMIEKATNSAISLKGKLSELDKMINEHEKANEVQIFEEWKKSEINSFNQFIDLKNEELKNKKDMYQEHYEEVIKIYHAQKIQSYQSDFEAQMNNYRKKIESSSPSYNEIIEKPEDDIIHNLEQVELETADDREALENFLESGSDDDGV
ncbi:2529_t:CDS:2 [Entrophospora sp. SA101]|nr:2529_t:CDS:2 [Entrophospora sp. SA101]